MADLQRIAAVKQESRGMVITLSGGVLFASNESTLLPAAMVKLNEVADALIKGNPDSNITVEGHTDSQGQHQYNLDLGKEARGRRARSARLPRRRDGPHQVGRHRTRSPDRGQQERRRPRQQPPRRDHRRARQALRKELRPPAGFFVQALSWLAAGLALAGLGCRFPGEGRPYVPTVETIPSPAFSGSPPLTARAIRVEPSDLEHLGVEVASNLGMVEGNGEEIAQLGGRISSRWVVAARKPEATSVCGRYDGPGRLPCGPWRRRWNDWSSDEPRASERGSFLVLRVERKRWTELPTRLQPSSRPTVR